MGEKVQTLEQVVAYHKQICEAARNLIERKGHDYSRQGQAAGDTLFNLRVAELLGIVPTAERGILVRLSDKFMRLVSLMQPGVEAKVSNESLRDTVVDIINYSIYALQIWEERQYQGQNQAVGVYTRQLTADDVDGMSLTEVAARQKPVKITTTLSVNDAKDYTLVPGGNFDY